MKRYYHLSMEVYATKLLGWSDMPSEKLFLTPGNYSINP
jgi:hypothetical protein